MNKDQNIAKNYWEEHPEAAHVSQWTSNPIIAETVYKRMSGGQTSKHWLSWLIEDFFTGKKFNNLLSLGCGTGEHEVIIAKSGIVNEIDAFDFSNASLNIAKSNASQARVKINFYSDNLNTFIIKDANKYDLALCSGSLHHVRELERFLEIVNKSLNPDGYFIINEYIGDCYNVYNDRQLELINRLYKCISPEMRVRKQEEFTNHSIQQSILTDPSESVRSKLIMPFLKEYFHIEVFNPFGGGILHPLYPMLNHNQFLPSDNKSETILRLLLEIEAILMEIPGGLQTDFCLCICKPRKYFN